MWLEVVRFVTSLVVPIDNITIIKTKIGLEIFLRLLHSGKLNDTTWCHGSTWSSVSHTKELTQLVL